MSGPRYEALLARQLAMNQESWRALRAHGLTESTEVRLDFFFNAPDPAAAGLLRDLLRDQTDYQVDARSAEGDNHAVVGQTQLTKISPDILDQWVDWMVTAGLEADCDFDGWGTSTPGAA